MVSHLSSGPISDLRVVIVFYSANVHSVFTETFGVTCVITFCVSVCRVDLVSDVEPRNLLVAGWFQ